MNLVLYYSITAKISSSFNTRYVSLSRLTSVPAYCWNTTRSPSFTSGVTLVPSFNRRPVPTATITPSFDFSLALSVKTIPLLVVCSCSFSQ